MVNNTPKGTDGPKEREYTSLRVEPRMWKQVKIKAIETDQGVSDFVENSLSMTMELLDNKDKGDKALLNIVKAKLGLKG
ncbi:MAG: hypothetical protein ACLQEQ_03230 [Nitrososphaerales archaeon]